MFLILTHAFRPLRGRIQNENENPNENEYLGE